LFIEEPGRLGRPFPGFHFWGNAEGVIRQYLSPLGPQPLAKIRAEQGVDFGQILTPYAMERLRNLASEVVWPDRKKN